MIVRPSATTQLLITQPDHAALAGRMMRQWRAGGLPEARRRDWILAAVEQHDNGWREVDAAPIRDEATGRLHDFVTAPDAIRRGVWPRAIERLAATPYTAALVAQHAAHVYGRYRGDPAWTTFFVEMEASRDHHLRAAGSIPFDEFLREYFYVRIGDLLSLAFCTGWSEVKADVPGYEIRLDQNRVTIAPDPFDGREIALEVPARELPNRPFGSALELEAAFARARQTTLTGTLAGARS
jgi:Protein of unknown function (DUF3891)